MTNKTPPAWATLAAIEICGLYSDKDYTIDDMGLTIANYAPDAEALAVALEKVKKAFASYEIMFPAKYAYLVNTEIHAALTTYRARFPLVDSSPASPMVADEMGAGGQ